MGQEDRRADPLIRAIGEMRSELLGWIDERLEDLRRRETTAESPAVASPPIGAARETTPFASRATDAPRPVEKSPEPIGMTSGGDARRRLDHLARQLGERLRQTESAENGPEPTVRDARP